MTTAPTLQSLIAERWIGRSAAAALKSAVNGKTVYHTHSESIDFAVMERHENVATTEVTVIARIHGNRLRPAKHHGRSPRRHRSKDHEQRQEDRHERVDVLDRVPTESARVECRAVALEQGDVAMRDLMRDDREQQDWGVEEDLLENLQRRRSRAAGPL